MDNDATFAVDARGTVEIVAIDPTEPAPRE